MALKTGLQLVDGRFTLVRRLGHGGMGEVWLATDTNEPSNEGKVALKFLSLTLRSNPRAMELLRAELNSSRRLNHDNILRSHDLQTPPDEPPFIKMEYVDGPSLHVSLSRRTSGRFDWGDIQPLIEQLLAALAYAHSKRVIHRDLKPANILVDAGFQVKLADFGIAQVVRSAAERSDDAPLRGGTGVYMSPQQRAGEPPSESDDIYSLGVTLYELLTGSPPVRAEEVWQEIDQSAVPPRVNHRLAAIGASTSVPPNVEGAIARCLEPLALARPRSVAEVAKALGLPLPDHGRPAGHPIVVRPPRPVVLRPEEREAPVAQRPSTRRGWYVALPLLIVVLWYVIFRPPRPPPQPSTETPGSAQAGWLRVASVEWPPGDTRLKLQGSAPDGKTWETNLVCRVAPAGDVGLQLPSGEWRAEATPAEESRSVYSLARGAVKLEAETTNTLTLVFPKTQPLAWISIDPAAGQQWPAYGVNIVLTTADGRPVTNFVHYAGHGVPLRLPVDPGSYLLSAGTGALTNFANWVNRRVGWVSAGETNLVQLDLEGRSPLTFETAPEATAELTDVWGNAIPLTRIDRRTWLQWTSAARVRQGLLRLTVFKPYYERLETNLMFEPARTGKLGSFTNLVSARYPPGYRCTNTLGIVLVPVGGAVWGARTEVNVRQFRGFADATGLRDFTLVSVTNNCWTNVGRTWREPGFDQTDDHAVVGVSWEDAVSFCRWLTEEERQAGKLAKNQAYSLPSDEQWSMIAREEASLFPWGTDDFPPPVTDGNYGGPEVRGPPRRRSDQSGDYDPDWPTLDETRYKADPFPRTAPVESGAPNGSDFLHIGGNVSEWCLNKYRASSNKAEFLEDNPDLRQDGGGEVFRTVRGGSWYDGDKQKCLDLRTALRRFAPPDYRCDRIGFRIVLTETKPEEVEAK